MTELVGSGAARARNATPILMIALGGIFIDAYDFTSISFGLSDITDQFDLSSLMVGVVGSAIMLGALIGALAGGFLIDKLGRYQVFMADMLFFVVAAIGCGLSPNVETLIVFRFLMGIGIGMDFPVALAFIAEYSASKGRGGRVGLWQPMWYVATSSTFLVLLVLYAVVPADDLWRWVVGLGAVPALVVMSVRGKYMDESPTWAANHGDLDRAAAILNRGYDVEVTVAEDADRTPVTHSAVTPASMAKVWTPRYRWRTIQAGAVSACQSAEYYAVGFGIPTIIAGILAEGRLETIIGSLVFNALFGITGGFAGVALAQRLGTWKLATSGFAVTLTVMVLLAVIGKPSGTWAIVGVGLLLGIFVFFHAYGPGSQGGVFCTTSYPTSLRGIGSGFGHSIDRVGSIVSLLVFPLLSTAYATGAYWFVALAPALGLLTLLLIRWDPSQHDVDAEDWDPEPPRPGRAPATAPAPA
ncbi:MFS transporter [Marmoricola endophyticus]|uniref:MFS transporter n=1 Tax=Marmoricola endophyticus TaxID=2040280 RepID=A0A917BLG5_9ACTN|nr:MFS transporter [Marmoricola endophyticus]GGF47098.1 MFS transporter [Marmoricola endophyticus]